MLRIATKYDSHHIVPTTIISSSPTDPVSSNNNDSAIVNGFTPPPTGADLAVDVSVDNSHPGINQRIGYTVQVSNGGPQAASNIEIHPATKGRVHLWNAAYFGDWSAKRRLRESCS